MEADESSLPSLEAETADPQTPTQYNMEPEMEFIFKYKSLPQLWDTSDIRYSNRFERHQALEQLLPIYQQLKQYATVEDVKKKINSLRSNYNRELKKYESGQSGGSSYYPKVRYFPYLSFLRKSKHHDLQVESSSKVEVTNCPQSIKTEVKSLPQSPKDTLQSCSQYKLRTSPIKLKVKKEKLEEVRNSYQSQPYPRQNHQPYVQCHKISNPIALEWSETLARLDPLQRLYAKKAINDVLFEAELGNLHKHSVQINASDSYYLKTSPSPSDAGSEDVDLDPNSSTLADPISIKNNQTTPEREYKFPITFLQCSLENNEEQENGFSD